MVYPAVIPERSNRGKNWCFTLNNYTDDDIEHLKSLGGPVTYLIAGREVGASETPHLQGFVSLSERMRLGQVKSLLGSSPHCELARDVVASIAYCKKQGRFFEVGEVQPGPGSRNDLVAFKATVKGGTRDLKVLRELHSQTIARYAEFAYQYVRDNCPGPIIETHLLRPWQIQLTTTLRSPPSKRSIIFVVDLVGNTGKSWFCHYHKSLNNNVQVLVPGKKADMIYMVDTEARVVFLDCPRSKQGDFIQYDMLEELKNGYMFSPKYHSCVKEMRSPHVVVMMNEQPDMSKLSMDRYDLLIITHENNDDILDARVRRRERLVAPEARVRDCDRNWDRRHVNNEEPEEPDVPEELPVSPIVRRRQARDDAILQFMPDGRVLYDLADDEDTTDTESVDV